jgi:hypothetical protein
MMTAETYLTDCRKMSLRMDVQLETQTPSCHGELEIGRKKSSSGSEAWVNAPVSLAIPKTTTSASEYSADNS